MNCPQCNQAVPDGSKFCTSCGAKITATQQPTPQPAQQITAPSQMSPPGLSSEGYLAPNIYGASSQRNWLERLGASIPGYKGYQEKETRRDIDKLHREHLANMLFQQKAPINKVIRELSNNRRLFETGPVERVLQKLDKIENRIRYASYGYSGFFDTVKVKEGQLDQLYQFDLALINYVEEIKARVQHLSAQSGEANALKAAAQELEQSLDGLDSKFSQRFQAIENPAWFPS